jgi:hypothetical protein
VDLNGDGKVDAAIVTLDSRWVGSTLPSFNFTLNDSTRTNQKPDSAHPFYAGDSTRFLVPIVPPFAFGMTGFDTAQTAQMISTWATKDSTGKVSTFGVEDTFGVGDQVPPVILSAVIHRVENYKDPDTLVIKPSEPIDLSKAGNWLEVWRCGNGKGSCDSSQMAWVKVPADSVHQNKDGSYWFLVPPGDSGSISPNYKVRFSVGVADALHNTTDTSNIHWATTVTGVARPPLVVVTGPSRIPVIPASEQNKISQGTILLKVTKGKSDGTTKTMDWWEPGKGYVGRNQDVIDGCPNEDWCNGPTLEINRPARLIMYIYDLVGTFVTSRSISITQADLNAMEPDQLDRVSIRFDWNHRTNDGHLVATGVYLWRIVSYVEVKGKALPIVNNQLFKAGVKIQ